MDKNFGKAASILTHFQFKEVSPDMERQGAPTLNEAGVFVIACRKPRAIDSDTNFSIIEVREADAMLQPLMGRLSYWRNQRQDVFALVAWIADKKTRTDAVNAIGANCILDTGQDDQ